jgi:hypothetical protein
MTTRAAVALAAALSAFGCGAEPGEPASAPEAPAPWFTETAGPAGLAFTHDSGHRGRFLFPECVCGGAALFDMDGDGDLDAYLVQSGAVLAAPGERPGNRLFRNRGDGSFEDATEGSGADDRGYGIGAAAGDYDNDGDADLYVLNLGPNVLLRNDGGGRFTDVAAASGTGDPGWGVSAAFLDYDADGDLDLYVVNYIHWSPEAERDCYSLGKPDYCEPVGYSAPARDTLYRNDGDGSFTDVSERAGLSAAFGNGMGVVCGDFDGDGRIDIFVANDQMQNQLWLNRGDGAFRDAAAERGVAVDRDGAVKAGMGCDAADLDDDGDLDLLVVNLHNQSDSLFRNEGAYFSDRTGAAGLASASRPYTRFGLGFADFDNDGRLDVFQANGRVRRLAQTWSADPYAEPNTLLAGAADGRFVPVPGGGTSPPLAATSRAAAFGDVDNDGRIDVLVANRDGPAHLLRNVAPGTGRWIMFRVLEEHGRDALGATVTLSAGTRRLRRDVHGAYSYAAASDPRVHVGLGAVTEVRDVQVRWIDGTSESFGDFPAGRVVTLRQGRTRSAAARAPRRRSRRATRSACGG